MAKLTAPPSYTDAEKLAHAENALVQAINYRSMGIGDRNKVNQEIKQLMELIEKLEERINEASSTTGSTALVRFNRPV